MLKESDTAGYPPRRTHRTYTREFKAELVAAFQQPGVSIATLASSHAMNANVLHRWLKEHERSGCHQLIGAGSSGAPVAASPEQAQTSLQLNEAPRVDTARYPEGYGNMRNITRCGMPLRHRDRSFWSKAKIGHGRPEYPQRKKSVKFD